MSADFNLDAYGALLDAFASRGYTPRGYDDAEPAQRHLVVRHDLDMSITAALPLAEAEQARNISATYFVLVRTEMYNPFSSEAVAGLRRLTALGHMIGLHLDASLYTGRQALEDGAAAECASLESLLGVRVPVVSFHRPALEFQGDARPIAGRPHAYQPRFFAEMGYCSDSRGRWAHGHPLEHKAVAEGRALQLLTHPIWWQGQAAEPQARLDRFLDTRLETLDRELAANCDVYAAGRRRLK